MAPEMLIDKLIVGETYIVNPHRMIPGHKENMYTYLGIDDQEDMSECSEEQKCFVFYNITQNRKEKWYAFGDDNFNHYFIGML